MGNWSMAMSSSSKTESLSVLAPLTGMLLCKDWSLKLSSSYRICCNLTSENSERPVIRDRFRLRIFRPQDLVSAHDEICRHATSAPPTSSTPLNDLELAGFLYLFSFFFLLERERYYRVEDCACPASCHLIVVIIACYFLYTTVSICTG